MIPHRPILKGEPIPAKRGADPTKQREFWDMEVGDAKDFFGGYSARHGWQTLASVYGRSSGKKFTSRTMIKAGEQFLRIWRIK